MIMDNEAKNVNRRDFIKSGLLTAGVATAGLILPGTDAFAAALAQPSISKGGREISFVNSHTGERFSGEYWSAEKYLPDAFREIKSVMRDHRTNEIFPIDPRLIDILFVLQRKLGNRRGFEILSGYRSPKTNAILRRVSYGVAKKSLHMQGQAVDVRLPGTSLSGLRRAAMGLQAGGVGYYPSSEFVHIDTGRVRHW